MDGTDANETTAGSSERVLAGDEIEVNVLERFDAAAGEHPEAVVVDDEGSVWVTLHAASMVYVRHPDGDTERIVLPGSPLDGSTRVNGIALFDASIFVAVRSEADALAGVWRLEGGTMHRVAPLPAGSGINGLAAAETLGRLFVTDDGGRVFVVDPVEGTSAVWGDDAVLRPTGSTEGGSFGANGIAVTSDAVVVSVPATQSLWRLPILADGRMGVPEPFMADAGLDVVDDFDFDESGRRWLGAQFSEQRMTLVDVATLRQTTLATAENGLDQPTSAAFATDDSRTAYLTNGAFGSATGVPHPSLMKIRWGDEVEP